MMFLSLSNNRLYSGRMEWMKVLGKFVLAVLFAGMIVSAAHAATPAEFGFIQNGTSGSSSQSFAAGDEINVYFYVKANGHSGLNVINAAIKISDTSVVAPISPESYFSVGQIYSQLGFQKYDSAGLMNILVYIDPNNKPSDRSGYIGIIHLLAVKSGKATLTLGSLQVTEEGTEDQWVETKSIPTEITVVAQKTTSLVTSASVTPAATVSAKSVKGQQSTNVSGVSTGPEAAIVVSLLGGFLIYFVLKKGRRV